jgi:pyruvate dehydrogenase E2 component (dihydrolipoamide acetyltransferase)
MAVEVARLVEPTPMRRAIAKRMSDSKRDAPHFYVSTELEFDAALAELERLNHETAHLDRITVTGFLVHAVARALTRHPEMNCVWVEDGLALAQQVNIGVAVAGPGGVIAPALLGCESLDLPSIGKALADLVRRARAGGLRGLELTDATFTLSNLGMFPVSQFTAIVAPPQVAILALGAVQRVPRFRDDTVVPCSVLTATISADHRAVDGVDVARFLATLKELVERPGELG